MSTVLRRPGLKEQILSECEKIYNLYFDRTTIHGNIDTILTKVVPNPTVTRRAGKAQQTSVLKLVNKLNIGANNSL